MPTAPPLRGSLSCPPPRRFAAPGRAARAPATHVLALIALGIAVAVVDYRARASLGDDSSRFALAAALLDGRVPYDSLWSSRPPGSYAFDALALLAGDRTLGAQHVAAAIEGALIYPLLTYVAARRISGRHWPAIAAAVCVTLAWEPVPGIPLAPALAAITLAAGWLATGSGALMIAAGLACGIEIAFSMGMAAATVGAVALTIVVRGASARQTPTGRARVRALQPLAALATGVAAGAAPFLAGAALEGGLPTLLRYAGTTAGAALRGAFEAPVLGLGSADAARRTLPLFCLPLALAIAARAARRDTGHDHALGGVLLASWLAMRASAAAALPESRHAITAAADLPLLAAWAGGWVLHERGRILLGRWDFALAVSAGLGSAAAWRIFSTTPAAVLIPLAAALACAGARLAPRLAVPAAERRAIRVTALVLLVAALPAASVLAPGRLLPDAGGSRLSGALWPRAEAEQVRRASVVVGAITAADDAILVYPGAGFLYEATQRRVATSLPDIEPRAARFEVRRALADLERDPPAAVVVRYEQAGRASAHLAPLTRYLEEHYVENRRLDSPELWGIWTREDAAQVCYRLMLYPFEWRGAKPHDARVGRRAAGRVEPMLVQLAPEIRFPIKVRPGAFVRFSISPRSDAPTVDRSIDLVAAGQRLRVWTGNADGLVRRIVLPPLPAERGELVLRTPGGRTTLWTDPTACVPR